MVFVGGRPHETMSKHNTHSAISTDVADALAATPRITHVRDVRTDSHSAVQFHCYLDDEPADVTVINAGNKPEPAIQAAYNATRRDRAHIIVTPDEVTGTCIYQWLQAPVMKWTGDGIRFYNRTQVLKHDGAVVVTAADTTAPAWWVRGTGADTDRARVCELRHEDRILATYDLEEDTVTLEDGVWTHIQRQAGEQAYPAITPLKDHQTTPRPTTWHPVGLPLTVPSTAPLTQSTVYALPDVSGDGVTPVKELSQEDARDDRARFQQVTATVSRMLAQRTVESPTATIGYDEFTAVCTHQLQAESGFKPYKTALNKALTAEDSVTIQRTAVDGQRELRGRAWAVPPSPPGD
ncbi:unknown [Haloarcula marismortui ATCC 43049]|uniref:Uncharacterized protein n=2 Tax=Haloarcula marismortui (strain ATCC 43049 / DSM 3752 / JCM 8966 / VKM B-1809) TaxID=272569 RepID=Q5V1X2_HALMA|nr:unknown [Haloarcula marismortui ATCC 43049]